MRKQAAGTTLKFLTDCFSLRRGGVWWLFAKSSIAKEEDSANNKQCLREDKKSFSLQKPFFSLVWQKAFCCYHSQHHPCKKEEGISRARLIFAHHWFKIHE